MGASFKKGAQIYDNVDINDEVRSESSGHSGKTGLSGLSGVTGKTAHSHGSKASSFSRKKENTDEFNYRDPTMPPMGKLVAYSLMTDRYAKAKRASTSMFENVQRECADSVCEARIIPVTKETDRVLISQDVQDRIALRRCKKDIRYYVSGNRMEIQKMLLFRKHSLDMMNHNYSNAVVRHVEAVDAEGARNTNIYADNANPDPVAEAAASAEDMRSVTGSVNNSAVNSPVKAKSPVR